MVSNTAVAGKDISGVTTWSSEGAFVARAMADAPFMDLERRRLDADVARMLAGVPGVQRVYVRDGQGCREYFVVAEMADRDTEDEFYRREAGLVRSVSPGIVAVHLINLAWFEPSPGFSPPADARPLELQTRAL